MTSAYNFTKKDEINSVSATPLQKVKGQVLKVTGAAITFRPDEETGEEKKVGLLSTDQGTFSSISATAIKGLELIIEYMDEEKLTDCEVRVNASKSNAGREFITLEIV